MYHQHGACRTKIRRLLTHHAASRILAHALRSVICCAEEAPSKKKKAKAIAEAAVAMAEEKGLGDVEVVIKKPKKKKRKSLAES